MTTVQIPYRHRKGGHCGSGALRDLTEWAELGWGAEELGEGLVFTLGGALAFSYVRSPQLFPQAYLVGRGTIWRTTTSPGLARRSRCNRPMTPTRVGLS